jgi:hypothetical protein
MCLVFDASTSTFVPQDLATYVENTPAFKNKIQEVAGTATLVAPDGTSLVASVEIYSDATYLPAVGNTVGDIAFVEDTEKLYIFKSQSDGWIETVAAVDLTGYATETYVNNQITGASTTQTVNMAQNGTLAVTTGVTRWYAPEAITINKIVARISTAGNAQLGIDVKKNGTSASVINIATGTYETTVTPSISMSEGDYLTVDITSVGSTPGENLNVQIFYTT